MDTQCWLWIFLDPSRLSVAARSAIENETNEVFVSAAVASLSRPTPPISKLAPLAPQHLPRNANFVGRELTLPVVPAVDGGDRRRSPLPESTPPRAAIWNGAAHDGSLGPDERIRDRVIFGGIWDSRVDRGLVSQATAPRAGRVRARWHRTEPRGFSRLLSTARCCGNLWDCVQEFRACEPPGRRAKRVRP